LRKLTRLDAAHLLWAAATLILFPLAALAEGEPEAPPVADFPALPLPPAIEGLIGFPQTYTKARSTYLPLITREAEQRGLPPAIADAVVKVESGFNPNAVGGVGEVGLMQVRPETAAMLGYQGGVTGLLDPETNVRFGVTYLARAWQLANGDVCRALMKYRAGWGEERMIRGPGDGLGLRIPGLLING
jgi:soluble lytic murein transglycosylase-like protein